MPSNNQIGVHNLFRGSTDNIEEMQMFLSRYANISTDVSDEMDFWELKQKFKRLKNQIKKEQEQKEKQ